MSNESKINIRYGSHLILLLSILIVSACGTTKYLKEGEVFLDENIVKIQSKQSIEKTQNLEANLLAITLQKPNSRFFGINRRWFYYNKERKGKLKKEEEAGARHVYETPSIYQEELAQQTIKSMSYYLEDRGYFHPKISYETSIKNQRVTVTYLVNPGPLFSVNSIRYISPDTTIQALLDELSPTTVLQKLSLIHI